MWGSGKVTVNLPEQIIPKYLTLQPKAVWYDSYLREQYKMLLWANPNPSVNYISFALPSPANPNPISYDTFDCSRSPTSHRLTLV